MTVIPVGTHCVLELHGCSADHLNNEGYIRGAVAQAADEGLSTLLSITSHQFQPQGVTALALLAESHISVHTWPEHGYAAVDIFTCGETAQPQRACAFLVRALAASDYTLKVLPRGAAIQDENDAYDVRLTQEQALCPAAG